MVGSTMGSEEGTHDGRLLFDNHYVGWSCSGRDALEEGPQSNIVADVSELVVDRLACQSRGSSAVK